MTGFREFKASRKFEFGSGDGGKAFLPTANHKNRSLSLSTRLSQQLQKQKQQPVDRLTSKISYDQNLNNEILEQLKLSEMLDKTTLFVKSTTKSNNQLSASELITSSSESNETNNENENLSGQVVMNRRGSLKKCKYFSNETQL